MSRQTDMCNPEACDPDNAAESWQLIVPEGFLGQRLDTAAALMFPDYSRARLQGWIRDGQLQVDGQTCKPSHKLAGGEILTLEVVLEPQGDWQPEDIPLDIVHADDHLIVINKPSNLVVHPAAGNPGGTLLNGLLHRFPELRELPRAGIVHRLDKDTTGLLVVARSLMSHTSLVQQLQARTMGREYLALVQGRLSGTGSVNEPIGRHPRNRQKMAVVRDGKPAVTHYRVLQQFDGYTWVSLKLETGRTHQIRVHMAHRGHPLLGDQTYGRRTPSLKSRPLPVQSLIRQFSRQALHARRLTLQHPDTGQSATWEAPLPADLQALIEALE